MSTAVNSCSRTAWVAGALLGWWGCLLSITFQLVATALPRLRAELPERKVVSVRVRPGAAWNTVLAQPPPPPLCSILKTNRSGSSFETASQSSGDSYSTFVSSTNSGRSSVRFCDAVCDVAGLTLPPSTAELPKPSGDTFAKRLSCIIPASLRTTSAPAPSRARPASWSPTRPWHRAPVSATRTTPAKHQHSRSMPIIDSPVGGGGHGPGHGPGDSRALLRSSFFAAPRPSPARPRAAAPPTPTRGWAAIAAALARPASRRRTRTVPVRALLWPASTPPPSSPSSPAPALLRAAATVALSAPSSPARGCAAPPTSERLARRTTCEPDAMVRELKRRLAALDEGPVNTPCRV